MRHGTTGSDAKNNPVARQFAQSELASTELPKRTLDSCQFAARLTPSHQPIGVDLAQHLVVRRGLDGSLHLDFTRALVRGTTEIKSPKKCWLIRDTLAYG